ncbi:hypothetical protein K7432_016107 [Basidiobolus ranarum]|uniref:Uncharacterized protein n=1 Tax=Basidiobolus ranarum TaxID=34480 RepID=A0ABR2WF82_9FUNG
MLLKQGQPVGRTRSNTIGNGQMKDVPFQLQHHPGNGKYLSNALTTKFSGEVGSTVNPKYFEPIQSSDSHLSSQWNPGHPYREDRSNEISFASCAPTIRAPFTGPYTSVNSAYVSRSDAMITEASYIESRSQPSYNTNDILEKRRTFAIPEQILYGQTKTNIENQRTYNTSSINDMLSSPGTTYRNSGVRGDVDPLEYTHPYSGTFTNNNYVERMNGFNNMPSNHSHLDESHVNTKSERLRNAQDDGLKNRTNRKSMHSLTTKHEPHVRYYKNRKSYPVTQGYLSDTHNQIPQSQHPSTTFIKTNAPDKLPGLASNLMYNYPQEACEPTNRQIRYPNASQPVYLSNKRQELYTGISYPSVEENTKCGNRATFTNLEHEKSRYDHTSQLNRNFESTAGIQLDSLSIEKRYYPTHSSLEISQSRGQDVLISSRKQTNPIHIHPQSQHQNWYSQVKYGIGHPVYISPMSSPPDIDISTSQHKLLHQTASETQITKSPQLPRSDSYQSLNRSDSSTRTSRTMVTSDESIYKHKYNLSSSNKVTGRKGSEAIHQDTPEIHHSSHQWSEQKTHHTDYNKNSIQDSVTHEYSEKQFSNLRQSSISKASSSINISRDETLNVVRYSTNTHIVPEHAYYMGNSYPLIITSNRNIPTSPKTSI